MSSTRYVKLSEGRRGFRGVVVSVGRHGLAADAANDSHAAPAAETGHSAEPVETFDRARESEIERRLLEMGFVEGAKVEILHEGFIGRDPLAVRVDAMRVALRRHEAEAVLVQPANGGKRP